MAVNRSLYRIAGTHLNVNTTEETALQLPQKNAGQGDLWLLTSFHYVRTGGTAASYIARMGQVAGWANSGIDERLTYASALVAVATSDVFAAPVPCKTDSTGKLYFRPGFNAGLDNDGEYEFYFEFVRGG
tara:strand:- start:379 stop:768 length:390 start_codon:yes stop_codon:yes gene_type:complete